MYACSSLLYQNDTSGGHSIVLYVLTINLLKNKFLFKVKYLKKKKNKKAIANLLSILNFMHIKPKEFGENFYRNTNAQPV